jgi:uncharacterized phage protein gp47/JayE
MPVPQITIDQFGIHVPPFTAILNGIVEDYQSIYGADVYVNSDSQDGQFLGLLATAVDDTYAGVLAAYNAFSPATAQGVGLSTVVKINGIEREVPTNSTAVVTVIGQANTTITNGRVQDKLQNTWNLPASVLIPAAGQINVTATAVNPGALQAAPNTLTTIANPQPGWQTVTNPQAAVVGAPVQTDAQLRITQSQSTMIPSISLNQSLQGQLLDLPGVTLAQVFENDTNVVDPTTGIPGSAISCVVAGGQVQDIINVIGTSKGQGVGTYGNTVGTFIDTAGTNRQISYFVPNQVPIACQVTLSPLTGFTTDIQAQIAAVISAYGNTLGLSQNVRRTRVFVPANLSGPAAVNFFQAALGGTFAAAVVASQAASMTYEIVDVQLSRDGAAVSDADVVLAFNEISTWAPPQVQFVIQDDD